LVSNIDPATARTGKLIADEDTTLKDAIPMDGAKNWEKIATLVPGRTHIQCQNIWHYTLVPNNDLTTALAGKWTEDEDKKLKDGVREHGGKNWKAIAAFVPGRTPKQCRSRWGYRRLVSKIDPTTAPGTRG
jgi:hypothetical protein